MYDPKHSLLHGLRVLCRHWRAAFDIARQNVARGARPTPLRDVLREVRAWRRAGADPVRREQG